MSHATNIGVPSKALGATNLPAGLGRLFLVSLQTLQVWYERSRQRRHLSRLDEHMLRDIGVDRIAAMEEASKPFWRD